MRDFRSDRYNNNRPQRDFAGQSGFTNPQAVNAVFRESMHQVLNKIRNEPFFKWSNKMTGNPAKCNQNLYYQYHQDHGHTMKDCRRRTGSCPSKVMSVARLSAEDANPKLKKIGMKIQPVLGLSDEDKIGTIQPHDDALVVTLKIGGYDVKSALVDQGSSVEIMYPDLHKGLNLRLEDLTTYNLPLVSFDGKVVIPKDHIRLSVQTGLEVVKVDFILVDAYSPYTAIIAKP
ncbi:uncharacterized protein LOC112002162 [Quercus suber]|uniref:uncharacterized protein LOC112002162 n=1 Tax=Quercus suber TaxID=58331 RepID=UPI000CE27C38|nr:uncharacterized protein LOC112002162 [Quercus suber]